MKSKPTKHHVKFSFEELPGDYSYRYTLQFILVEQLGKTVRNKLIEEISTALGIKRRAFEYYMYVRPADPYYFLSGDYLDTISEILGIDAELLTTPQQEFKQAS